MALTSSRLQMATRPGVRSLTDTLAYKSVGLMGVAGLCILLWASAIPNALSTLHRARSSETVAASVVRCPSDQGLSGQCSVSFRAGAREVTRQLSRTGFFAVEAGDQIPVWVDPEGSPEVGGWRPVVDALALLAWASIFTGFAVSWWRKVLRHDSPGYLLHVLDAEDSLAHATSYLRRRA